ncbi:pilus assembly protein [Bordetella muralis]|uniref:pilus assembly protein n=1 Tax=Bordetella muralis TaxID=1649130 RepID=UPI0039EF2254
MVEFGLVAISLLSLSLLTIEAAHWQITRQLAYVALLDSARAGATQHGRRDVIEQAFTQSFLPRFVYAGSNARTAQQRTWHRVQQMTGLPAWRIEILPPGPTPTLHARLTYLHEPLTPLIRPLLRRVAPVAGDCAARAALAYGFLAIRLDLHIEMHSHPMQWGTTPPARHDRVVYGAWNCGG